MNQLLHPSGSGHALVEGLAPGRYCVVAIPDDFLFEPELFQLEEERNEPVEVRWRRR